MPRPDTLLAVTGSDPRPFADQLSEGARAELETLGQPRSYQSGRALFREDDDGSQVMLLRRGLVKVSVAAASGREIILGVVDPGSLLGEISAVDAGPRSATVTALTEVEVLVLPHEKFVGFLHQNADAAHALLQSLATTLRGANRRQLEFGTADSLGRVCQSLCELADKYGEPTAAGRRFTMPMTQQDLASFAGLSREAVVKGLGALRALGWIATSGRVVELVDEAAIEARAADA